MNSIKVVSQSASPSTNAIDPSPPYTIASEISAATVREASSLTPSMHPKSKKGSLHYVDSLASFFKHLMKRQNGPRCKSPETPSTEYLANIYQEIENHRDLGNIVYGSGIYRESAPKQAVDAFIVGLNTIGAIYLDIAVPLHALAVAAKRILMDHFLCIRDTMTHKQLVLYECLDETAKRTFLLRTKQNLSTSDHLVLKTLLSHLNWLSKNPLVKLDATNLGKIFQVSVLGADRMAGNPMHGVAATQSTMMRDLILLNNDGDEEYTRPDFSVCIPEPVFIQQKEAVEDTKKKTRFQWFRRKSVQKLDVEVEEPFKLTVPHTTKDKKAKSEPFTDYIKKACNRIFTRKSAVVKTPLETQVTQDIEKPEKIFDYIREALSDNEHLWEFGRS